MDIFFLVRHQLYIDKVRAIDMAIGHVGSTGPKCNVNNNHIVMALAKHFVSANEIS